MTSQLQAQVSATSWQTLDGYMNGFLLPHFGALSLDVAGNPIPYVSKCDPYAQDCEDTWSEINFYNGGGQNYGLGLKEDTFPAGQDQPDYKSGITNAKISFLPPGLLDSPGNWMVIEAFNDQLASNGGSAGAHWQISSPQRGTYKIEAFHTYYYKGTQMTWNDFTPETTPAQPAINVTNVENNGYNLYDLYETPVDLGLTILNAQTDPTGQIVTGCSGPITVQANLSPPLPDGNQAPPITWTGGTAIDNLHRQLPCALGSTTITAKLGANLQTSMTVDVQGTVSYSSSNLVNGKVVLGANATITVTANSSIAAGAVYVWEVIADDPGAPQIAQLPGQSPYSPPSCSSSASCTVSIMAAQNGGKATVRVHLRSSVDGPDLSSADVRLIVVQINQVNLTVANHVGGGVTTQSFTAPFGPGPLLWPAALWTPPAAAVLVSGSIPSFTVNAVSTPAANDTDVLGWITFDVTHRAPDDAAQAQAVGGGAFAVTGYPNGTATVSANLAGSFQILVCVDTNLNNQCDLGETGVAVPLILVQATLEKNLSTTTPPDTVQQPITDTGLQGESRITSGALCNLRTLDGSLPFTPSQCPIVLGAEVDLLGGGPDGSRGVGQVYGGWLQDLNAPNVIATYQNCPAGGNCQTHQDVWTFANNITFQHFPYIYPNDPAPNPVIGPLIDSLGCTNEGKPLIGPCVVGTGGNTSLMSLSNQTTSPLAIAKMDPNPPAAPPRVGARLLISAADAPAAPFYVQDLTYPTFGLTQIQYNLSWVSYLTLWTSLTGIPDNAPGGIGVTGTPGYVGPPNADRTYAVLLEQPWNISATFNVDANGNGVLTTPPPNTHLLQLLTTVHSPVVPVPNTNAVLVPPTAQNLTAENIRN